MELRHLRYFVAVAEERHVTRAAERLGMQQPPLSQQIRALEAELGVQLLRRRPRGVEPTEAGLAFLGEAQAILARLAAATATARRIAAGEQGRLAVGVPPTAPFHPFVPGVIRSFREAWPLVTLTLEECLRAELVERLQDGRLDIAFFRAEAALPEGLVLHRLLEEPMVAALPAGHPLAAEAGPALTLAALAGETFIAYARQQGPALFEAMLAGCLAAGFSPRLGQEAPRVTSALSLVAAGLGVTLVPASTRRVALEGLAYRKLAGEAVPRAVLAIVARRDGGSAAARNFLALVRQEARKARD
ncbi:LysR family transcriptional regulator [Dankookia rubra]|uniref:LysR family transcriptional regulator n=1 Tax=Dankookia rubra TaxID=1442381 RepID=A0A4R5QH13_9PROT|nr:LysR family transcriptional regulator [Dankookia rubra]TDH62038.1 LysR family transcriptional regulator [Dankookia rubra]